MALKTHEEERGRQIKLLKKQKFVLSSQNFKQSLPRYLPLSSGFTSLPFHTNPHSHLKSLSKILTSRSRVSSTLSAKMGKQTKPKKGEIIGKGKVTPVQVAFIVDRYLSDNNFTQTRSSFRIEASQFISKSPVQEAPKSLLSLGAMLDDYICLKEQKVILDQEKYKLEQEKIRVQTLLKGMQDVMNAYSGGGVSVAALQQPMVVHKQAARVHRMDLSVGSPAGLPAYSTPVVMSSTRHSNVQTDPTNFSSPITNQPTSRKRNIANNVYAASSNPKRSRTQTNQLPANGTKPNAEPSNASVHQESAQQPSAGPSPTYVPAPTGSPVQGSSVAKCLFNEDNQSPPTSSDPKTPSPSQTDKPVSPPENLTPSSSHPTNVTPQKFTSTNCTVISSETIRVSPVKQISYYSIERNHYISSSPVKTNLTRFSQRDRVKGRLDFDSSDMTTTSAMPNPQETLSEKEQELFDFDFPGLDGLGVNFSLSDLLGGDFDVDGEDYNCQPEVSSSPGSNSGSPDTPVDFNMSENQVMSGVSSTMTEFFSEKDMNLPGSESVTSMKSITKCIKISSPAKSQKSPSQDQENLTARS